MYCNKCGAQIADDSKFCNVCGSQIANPIETDANGVARTAGIVDNDDQKINKSEKAETTKKGKMKKPLYKKWWFWVIIIILALIINGSKDNKKTTSTTESKDTSKEETLKPQKKSESKSSAVKEEKEEKEEKSEPEENIEYVSVSVTTLMEELNTNAMRAQETYKGKYIEITGKLSNIDASGSYIDLVPENDDFAIIGVQCYIKDDTQKAQVMSMVEKDIVTLRGKCKDVGEILGYSLDITSIDGYDDASGVVEDLANSEGVIETTADKLISDLNDNAMKAQQTYKGKKISVRGKLSNIDASGSYIDITSETDPYSFTFIQCYIKSDDVKQQVMDLAIDDVITIDGTCKDVGEVMGYSIDIENIR